MKRSSHLLGMWYLELHLIKLVGLCEVLFFQEKGRDFGFSDRPLVFMYQKKHEIAQFRIWWVSSVLFLNLHRNQSRDQPDKSQGHGSLATKIVIWLFRARSPIIFRINQIPGSQNNPNLALISKGSLFLAGSPKQRRNKKGFPSVYTIWINLINV